MNRRSMVNSGEVKLPAKPVPMPGSQLSASPLPTKPLAAETRVVAWLKASPFTAQSP